MEEIFGAFFLVLLFFWKKKSVRQFCFLCS